MTVIVLCLEYPTYGGARHICTMENNMADMAYNFYVTYFRNQTKIKPMHVIAAENVAYLAMKILDFIDTYWHPVLRFPSLRMSWRTCTITAFEHDLGGEFRMLFRTGFGKECRDQGVEAFSMK